MTTPIVPRVQFLADGAHGQGCGWTGCPYVCDPDGVMDTTTTALTLGGAFGVLVLRSWAYRASPRSLPASASEGEQSSRRAEFHRRLLVYYAGLALLAAGWALGAYFREHRGATPAP